MELTALVAPGMAFLVVALFGFGIYQLQNRGGILARRRGSHRPPPPSSKDYRRTPPADPGSTTHSRW